MTEWDREAAIAEIEKLFEGADENEVINRLGTPTRAAISVLRGYAPSPAPEDFRPDGEAEEPADAAPAEDAQQPPALFSEGDDPDELYEPAGVPEAAEAEGSGTPDEPAEEIFSEETIGGETAGETEEPSAVWPDREPIHMVELPPEAFMDEPAAGDEAEEARAGRLIVSRAVLFSLFGVVICLPAGLILTALALAFFGAGAVLLSCGVHLVLLGFIGITVLADIILIVGAGLVVVAGGIPVAYFGLWFFVKCVVGFVQTVLRAARSWCHESPEEVTEDE